MRVDHLHFNSGLRAFESSGWGSEFRLWVSVRKHTCARKHTEREREREIERARARARVRVRDPCRAYMGITA